MGDRAPRPALAVADHGLLLLAFRRERGELGSPAHLHAGELQGRRAGPARGRARHDGRILAAAAGEPRLCPHPLKRSIRAADHPDQLSRCRARPPRHRRRHEARAAFAEECAAVALLRLRGFPGPNVNTDDEFLAAATERGTTTFHPGCTCRMGPADSTWAVVDDHLRVHGLEGLRVIDASVMPRMISANLNASTMMIADRASDLIRGKAPMEAARIPDAAVA